MRTLLLIAWLCFAVVTTSAQNITTAEYYFDNNDAGFGFNPSFTINMASQTESFDISTLSNGFHDIHIRVFDQDGNDGAGAWSHYDRASFYIGEFLTGQNIEAARYRIDNGANNPLAVDMPATSISQSYSIGIGSLSQGFHSLYIETRDSDNTWSHYDRAVFYIANFLTGQNVVGYRYRIDDGTEISGSESFDTPATSVNTNFTVPLTGLDEGFYSFYVEAQLADGTWSHYDRQIIYINDFSDMPADIVEAEYFIDEDPGFGMGVAFDPNMNPFMAMTPSDISEGDHLLCVRVKNSDDIWSTYCCATFNVDNSLSVSESLYKSVSLKPNPFNESIQLELSGNVEFKQISVFDLTGKKVFSSANDLRKLELGNLQAGTYILRLSTETQNATFKIVKQ